MLPDFISFRKNLSQRKKEFNFLMNSAETCNNIHKLWAFDLELAFDSYNSNWQCLWQMSEESCTEYNTLHPTTVVVKVTELVFEELSAVITVEGVQEDLTFPENIIVPLIELFPTKEQNFEISLAVVRNISDWLDRCRFFFLYLWYPWDSDDDSPISHWAQSHLENRLKLQYDIRDETFDPLTTHYIQSIQSEAVEVADLIENGEDGNPDDDKKMSTIANLIRKETIKMELNFFETPELRNAMIKYITEKKLIKVHKTMLLVEHGNCHDIAKFINAAKLLLKSDCKAHISDCPTNAVDTLSSGSLLVLSEGVHIFPNLGNLSFGGEIKGVSSESAKTIIIPKAMLPNSYIFFNCLNYVLFENLTIERNEGVLLCSTLGTLKMKSCSLRGSHGCGVMVQSGCHLEMVDCIISNLSTGIIAKKNSTVVLESTLISNCSKGIKVMVDASLALHKVAITSSAVAAIVAMSSKENSRSGEIDILTNLSDITLNESIFEKNKVNALIEYC